MSSRETILQRLRNRTGGELTVPECDFSVLVRDDWSTKERIERFEKMIESVHGEVHHCTEDMWMERLAEVLNTRGARNLLIPKQHEIGQSLRTAGRSPCGAAQFRAHLADRPWQPHIFDQSSRSLARPRTLTANIA